MVRSVVLERWRQSILDVLGKALEGSDTVSEHVREGVLRVQRPTLAAVVQLVRARIPGFPAAARLSGLGATRT